MAALTEQRVGFAALFGRGAKALERAILATDDFDLNVARLSEFLAPCVKPLPVAAVEMRDLVERIERDASILRVEQLAAFSGLDVRTLQRHFFSRTSGCRPSG
jgi:hypothetical protein